MLRASTWRILFVLAVMAVFLPTEWWLFNHAQSIWPGLTGRLIVAGVGVAGLVLVWAATAWERRRRSEPEKLF